MTKICDLTAYLESIAPPQYQEGYDNAGLIVGDPNAAVEGVLFCLDSTEAIVEEAIEKQCNLIVAHHPIVFRGLKRLTGRNYVERVVIQAIRHGIAIYAIHTNLDNVYHQGVNGKIGERLGLMDTRLLAPKANLKKLSVLAPPALTEPAREALLAAGADSVAASEQLSYGGAGEGRPQVKLEVSFSSGRERQMLDALKVGRNGQQLAYELVSIENSDGSVGSGLIGRLPEPMAEEAFLQHLKKAMKASCIRHTRLLGKKVETVALCGGAGGFLLGNAKAAGAQFFVTADYKYHEFFDADGQLVIADIGHYESEQFTIELLHDIISQKFSNFAAHCTEAITNPIHYYC
ncbi:MAG: Nif3-like dinuclear metal center hexameric protein [Lewinellaceae bacterium]|nr:Nif3-like dinuclear metal center hexameric protein [Phaeodactylibacter sp.]MCB9347227.1 Nif3-like dinuclear metal center hexameric protein [Lewinellaceae bacterium]